ncbi:hypothetical protein XELAEV_18025458mg [Xenopus laevis]|uniref:Reelin domain-containing protein n=1 Tax=Xenopus laevis TaxID=8355 RepID=A0A974HMD7_XENLA|nr:hypothetical protein XELAEV_18025458mg [Xenopus laevis]
MDSSLQITVILLTICSLHVSAYPSGKVEASCNTMVPGHGVAAQTSASPYTLDVSSTTYEDEQSITVTLRNTSLVPPFKGFMIQARAVGDGNNIALGTFTVSNSAAQTLQCSTANSAVSHTSAAEKTAIQVTWMGPNANTSAYEIRATVVQSRNIFWINVRSSNIKFTGSGGFRLLAPALSQLLLGASALILMLLIV